MAYRKLGRPTDQRQAILRNLTTALIWNEKIETTETRAKEVRSIAEKLITLAVKQSEGNAAGKGDQDASADTPSKLAARRRLIAYLYNVPMPKQAKETRADYKQRTGHVHNPVVEKLFREIGPRYAARAQDVGQGGGYTRIVKIGPRRGDAAPMAKLELI